MNRLRIVLLAAVASFALSTGLFSARAAKLDFTDYAGSYKDDQIIWENMKKGSISKQELMESLHLETKKISLESIEIAFLETNGRISFILKEK